MPAALRVVWLYGPPSTGKTSTAWALYQSVLSPWCGYVDIDQLGMCYPAPPTDPHRDRLKARALGHVLGNARAFGVRLVIVSGVLDPALLPLYRAEFPDVDLTLCRLTVDPSEHRRRHLERGRDEASAERVVADADAVRRAAEGVLPFGQVALPRPIEKASPIGRGRATWRKGSNEHVTVDTTTGDALLIARRVAELTRLTDAPPLRPEPPTPAPLTPSEAPGRVVVLIGPDSVGKSTVAWSLFTRAQVRGVAGLLDLRQLGFLPLASEEELVRHRFRAANVASMWSTFSAWRARTLIVNGRVPDRAVLDTYRRMLPRAEVRTVRLRAGAAELERRLRQREQGLDARLPGELAGASPDEHRRRLRSVFEEAEALDRERPGDAVVDTDDLAVEEVTARVEAAAGLLGHMP